MRFLLTVIALVIGFSAPTQAQEQMSVPLFSLYLAPPTTPVPDIYIGPLPLNPMPDPGIATWIPSDPTQAIDCCERLQRLEFMRNEYDILDERIDDEYTMRDLYLDQGPLSQEQATIVLTITMRIMHLESELEQLYSHIVLQGQIYDTVCPCSIP
jgi:hypothetical protein